MTRIQLFAIPNFTQAKKPVFSSFVSQQNYFNNHSKIIDIDGSYIPEKSALRFMSSVNCENSTHVRVIWNNRELYFVVVSIKYTSDGVTEVIIQLDNWLTYKKQNNLTLGNGHVSRRANSGSKPKQPFNPISMTATVEKIGAGMNAFFSANISTMNPKMILYGRYNGSYPNTYITELESGNWANMTNVLDGDVAGVWLVPWDFGNLTLWNIGGAVHPYSDWVNTSRNSDVTGFNMPSKTVSFNSIYTDELHTGGIMDGKGNIVFTVPFGKTANQLKGTLRLSLQSCQIECVLNNIENNKAHAEGMSFNIAGDPLDFVIDSFAEYSARQRQYDMQSRDLQSRMAMYNGIGQSVGSGALTGAIGGGVGALAGVGAGVLSAGISRALDNSYAPKIQALQDTLYKHQVDTLSLAGTSIGRYAEQINGLFAFQLTADSYTINRMSTDLSINGVYVDETISSGESLLTGGVLQGDFEILGTCPYNAKLDIAESIRNGIRTVNL
jgi:hypothetical protein